MKKHLIVLIVAAFFIAVPHVFAQADNFVPLAPISGLTDLQPAGDNVLATFFNNLYKFLIGIAASIAVIMIIWGGFEYSTQDSVSKKGDAKKRIYQALFGLLLVLSPVLVFSVINPSILNLSVGLKKIDLTVPQTTTTTNPRPPVQTPSGCLVSGSSGTVLQYAICPSSDAAKLWGQTCTDNLSSVYPYTTAGGGQTSQYLIFCSTKTEYVFIETVGTFLGTIEGLQPLAKTDSNPNNASQAIQFANLCKAVGPTWATCVSDLTGTSFSVPCSPPPSTLIPAGQGSGKCYKETLTCFQSALGARCSKSPNWAPFN
ncbi:MAG TPA: pilin [Candidatus Paceibacterota bacterium]|nr:pilin [Candidatus Paceibacterota bacterium]